MFDTGTASSAAADMLRLWAAACDQAAAADRELAAFDPAAFSDEELLGLLDGLEVDARRRAAVGCGLIAELAGRGLAAELGYASPAVLLSERLRIGRREAAGGAAIEPRKPADPYLDMGRAIKPARIVPDRGAGRLDPRRRTARRVPARRKAQHSSTLRAVDEESARVGAVTAHAGRAAARRPAHEMGQWSPHSRNGYSASARPGREPGSAGSGQ